MGMNGVVEELLAMDWVVAAEVTRISESSEFVLHGLFFPVDYAMGDEWANDFGLDEVEAATLASPADWMSQQERNGIFVPGTYPVEPCDLRFWRQTAPERYFVTLEVNAREFSIVRHIASCARSLGLGRLIGEDGGITSAQTEH
ncbi:hypothetical protein [Paraburkholderia aromaticivorans]|uniref:hypothetical protein n=1 Tax=Paraburkholderia aromaticivorans TaxID=2026199 RepID=UPI00145600E6|nr:hypothetical protein [Paraburkholderia aromaticivorans]